MVMQNIKIDHFEPQLEINPSNESFLNSNIRSAVGIKGPFK
jgi:hypothetical protein